MFNQKICLPSMPCKARTTPDIKPTDMYGGLGYCGFEISADFCDSFREKPDLATENKEIISAPIPPIPPVSEKSVDLSDSLRSNSFTKDFPNTDEEKQENWTKYATQPLCKKHHGRLLRNLLYNIMTMYRRLFMLIFLANLPAAINMAVSQTVTVEKLVAACLANLTAAVVIRNENFINLLFRVSASVPKSWPLTIRRWCAKVYTLGGIHSGCASFAVIWLVWLTALLTKQFVEKSGKVDPSI
jgi:hypothetical protein